MAVVIEHSDFRQSRQLVANDTCTKNQVHYDAKFGPDTTPRSRRAHGGRRSGHKLDKTFRGHLPSVRTRCHVGIGGIKHSFNTQFKDESVCMASVGLPTLCFALSDKITWSVNSLRRGARSLRRRARRSIGWWSFARPANGELSSFRRRASSQS